MIDGLLVESEDVLWAAEQAGC